MKKSLDQYILECPGGISLDTVRHLKDVFSWVKSVPGNKDANSERYLQMSGWYDVIDYLEAVAKCQHSGQFPSQSTGKEGVSILDKFKQGAIFNRPQ